MSDIAFWIGEGTLIGLGLGWLALARYVGRCVNCKCSSCKRPSYGGGAA